MIEGHRPENPPPTDLSINIRLINHIKEKLKELAAVEGSEKENLTKEAIAEFIRTRQ